MLLALLKFSRKNILINTGFSNLCKMINSFLDHPIIPDTRHLLDNFFFPKEGREYHAVCPKCQSYVGQFDHKQKTIECIKCGNSINLKSPCYRDYFVVLDFETELIAAVESNSEYYLDTMKRQRQGETYADI